MKTFFHEYQDISDLEAFLAPYTAKDNLFIEIFFDTSQETRGEEVIEKTKNMLPQAKIRIQKTRLSQEVPHFHSKILFVLSEYSDEEKRFLPLYLSFCDFKKHDQDINLINTAAHELKTPMSVIQGYVSFLENEHFGPLTQEQKDFLRKISKNVSESFALIHSLLDISKLESGKKHFSYKTVNLNLLFREVFEKFQTVVSKKHQTLSFNPPKENIFSNTDREKVLHVLQNLLGNAHKFTPNNGNITLSLGISPSRANMAECRVSDTGIGIAKEHISHLFEKFYQVPQDSHHKEHGSGLGLSIVKEILKNLGGDIRIDSEPQKGSTFTFFLPLSPTS